jgi:hypothetical protein
MHQVWHSADRFRLWRRTSSAAGIRLPGTTESGYQELLAARLRLDAVMRDGADRHLDGTGRGTAILTSRHGGHRLRRP